MAVNGKVKQPESKKEAGLVKFLREVKAEVTRITWPSKDELKKAFIAVLIFALVYMVLVGGVDFILQNLFDLIFKLKK
ncbi:MULTISPECIES: preprotein translocase subunit SecE [Clostridium]|jgi:preprotein translocase subunit SecE|uniref:Protein translocase subunit SecE n=1 Tax=Clostridium manihotivorum TaxID=2320868 RepID=A0A410DP31_9CLOT|nr:MULTISPECIES: preprotein translocase subunit SecE [Clostridium]QAA30806.1 preprotein translocase subunit SecE [Clostridium manihotivorum]